MKKTILSSALFIVIVLVTQTAAAQVQKGNIMIGGDIANLDLGLNNGGAYSFLVNPKVAWFVRTGIAVGGYANLQLSGAKEAGTSVNYGLGALGRYYIMNPNTQAIPHSMFFVEGNVGIEGNNPAKGDNTNGLGLGIGPGWTYFVNPHVGLEVLFKYNGIVGFGTSPTSNDLNLFVGFQIYLGSSEPKKAVKDIERK